MPLAAPRNLPRLGETNQLDVFRAPIAANVRIFAGAAVVLDNTGAARPARVATTDRSFGVAEREYNNLAGAAGALIVEGRAGVFGFRNSTAGDAIAQANVGATVFWSDDDQVALTNGGSTRSAAGVVVAVNEGGDGLVYVRVSLT
jgi:predicted RecA/RadA family phage recombinase